MRSRFIRFYCSPVIHIKALHNGKIKCPQCSSTNNSKNGHRCGKQNYICRDCHRQFVESYSRQGYADEIKQQCRSVYVNGMGFRAIERVMGVNHNTVINWVKQAASRCSDVPESEEIPEISQVDELQTFIAKKNKIWVGTAVNKEVPGILAWVRGDRSAETFKHLWQTLSGWKCFLSVTDGYPVYPCFIDDAGHLVQKTYMTLVI